MQVREVLEEQPQFAQALERASDCVVPIGRARARLVDRGVCDLLPRDCVLLFVAHSYDPRDGTGGLVPSGREGRWGRLLFAPFVSLPEPDRWTLPLLYLVFFLVVATLYWPCRWFDGVKSYQRKGRLRYL